MAAAAPGADFKLVLNAINPEQRPAIIQELMVLLQLDQKTATSATENVPLVLVGGMTQQQALTLRTHIPRLLRLGCDLKLTAEPVGKIKQLRWQAPPAATRIPGNLFVCPSCGDRFVVQRWQPQAAAPQPATEEQPQRPAPPASPAAAAPAPSEEEPAEAEPVEAEPLEAEPVEAEPAEEVEEALPAEEITEAPEPEQAAPAAPEPAEVQPVGEEDDLLGAFAEEVEAAADEPQPAEQAPPEPPPQPAPGEPAPEAAPPTAEPAPAPAPPEPAPAEAEAAGAEPPEEPEQEEAEPVEAEPPEEPEQEEAGPRYDVSVAKVRGEDQEKLAEYLAQRRGLTFEEALKLCGKTVVVVVRGGTSAEADKVRRALLKMGIKPRIRKRSG